MPRPRKDGAPARAAQRRRLDDRIIKNAKAEDRRVLVWDTLQPGLALAVEPSGKKSFKYVYRFNGRVRWYNVGDVRSIGLSDARKLVKIKSADVVHGTDVQAARRAQRMAGTFRELADRYRDEWAKRRNKSWQQARALVERNIFPTLGNVPARDITRGDIRAIHRKLTDAGSPVMANQILAAASAIFSWAIKAEAVDLAANPCSGIERNETKDRERVLSDAEVHAFWNAFDDAGLVAASALRTILLTGQRPGEVSKMRWEHLDIGRHKFTDANRRTVEVQGAWWTLPGEADEALGWPGTKNRQTHRVWLSETALAIINEVGDATTGFVFAGPRGRPVDGLDKAMRAVCDKLGIAADKRARPHDLRRTHGTTITAIGFTREQMDRIMNHADGGVGAIYDRHGYADEARRIQEAVSARIAALVAERADGNVVPLSRRK